MMRTFSSARLRSAVAAATLVAAASTSTISPAAAQPAPPVLAAPAPGQQQNMAIMATVGAVLVGATALALLGGGGSPSLAQEQTNPDDEDHPDINGSGGNGHSPSDDVTTPPTGGRRMIIPKGPVSGGASPLIPPKEPNSPQDGDEGFADNKPIPGKGPLSVDEGRAIIYRALNADRVAKGLPALTPDAALEESANGAARFMQKVAEREGTITRDRFSKFFKSWVKSVTGQDKKFHSGEVLWWSRYNLAPEQFVTRVSASQDRAAHDIAAPTNVAEASRFTKVGVGVARDAETGQWFFVVRVLGPKNG